MKNKKWLLVDGHNMAFRCFYGIPRMTTTEGLCVNAIYGWIRSLWKLEDIVRPDGVCVFFDAGGSVDRRNILSEYKAHRKPMPDDLKQQLHYLNLSSIAHGYYVVSQEGVEADDLLAAFAGAVNAHAGTAYIASGDKDFAQCVGDGIFQLLPPSAHSKGEWRLLDAKGVESNFGISPEQIVDYLSLLGDTSDNISGVSGIGEKTAKRLLREFGTVSNVLQNTDKILPKKLGQNILASRDLVMRNRELISLSGMRECILPEAKISRSVDDIFQLLRTLQFNSLLKAAHKRYSLQEELF